MAVGSCGATEPRPPQRSSIKLQRAAKNRSRFDGNNNGNKERKAPMLPIRGSIHIRSSPTPLTSGPQHFSRLPSGGVENLKRKPREGFLSEMSL